MVNIKRLIRAILSRNFPGEKVGGGDEGWDKQVPPVGQS